MKKAPEAFRTISEVSDILQTPAHVLRFWESKFYQIRPVKRAGGRRYYRPDDVALVNGIRILLQDHGMTIRGVQRVLQEQGVKHVAGLGGPLPLGDPDEAIDVTADLSIPAEAPVEASVETPDETPAATLAEAPGPAADRGLLPLLADLPAFEPASADSAPNVSVAAGFEPGTSVPRASAHGSPTEQAPLTAEGDLAGTDLFGTEHPGPAQVGPVQARPVAPPVLSTDARNDADADAGPAGDTLTPASALSVGTDEGFTRDRVPTAAEDAFAAARNGSAADLDPDADSDPGFDQEAEQIPDPAGTDWADIAGDTAFGADTHAKEEEPMTETETLPPAAAAAAMELPHFAYADTDPHDALAEFDATDAAFDMAPAPMPDDIRPAKRLRNLPRGSLGRNLDAAQLTARRIDALLERMSEASGAGRW